MFRTDEVNDRYTVEHSMNSRYGVKGIDTLTPHTVIFGEISREYSKSMSHTFHKSCYKLYIILHISRMTIITCLIE